MATASLALPVICTTLTVVVAGAVAVIAIGRVVVAAKAGPVALLVAVALVPVVAVALIPTLTLTCGGSRAQGPMDRLAHAGARMEEILPFGWRGYYGNSAEAKVLLFCRGRSGPDPVPENPKPLDAEFIRGSSCAHSLKSP